MSDVPAPKKKNSLFSRKKKSGGATPAASAEPGRIKQIKTLYTMSCKQDPKVPLYLIGAFLAGFLPLLLIGLIFGHPIYFGLMGLPVGLLVVTLIFGRIAQKAAYGQLDGQPGAAGAAMSGLRKGWYFEQEPVAAETSRARNVREVGNAAMVFRAVGRAGVVLVAEGPRPGAIKLLASERKRVSRVSGPEVPVHTLRVGEGDDAIPVSKLTTTMTKLPRKLTDAEVAAVNKRLRAIGGIKPPIPKGTDPRTARADRKATRGR